MVSEQDVRDVLTDLSTDRVPPATIEKQIELANTTVENSRTENIDEATLEDARLVFAAYYTLNAYATAIERATGGTPPDVSRQLAFWERLSETYRTYISRGGEDISALPPLVAQPETLLEQCDDGDLDGDPY